MDTPPKDASPDTPKSSAAVSDRRGFIAKGVALVLGAAAYAVPVLTGLAAFLSPLGKKSAGGGFVRLASLDTLPDDGSPQKVPVVAERVDGWTRSVEPIGAVYLRKTGPGEVLALNATCPHAGCTIDYRAGGDSSGHYTCPCHKAGFDLAGERMEADSYSPRDMDVLEAEVRDGDEVWVRFQSFQVGTSQKTPVA